jgi:predicted transposase/invertase (TIGR01784 family)
LKAKYINPYTDFGFKKLFGEEGNKDLLIDFLNQLLPSKHTITNLSFRNPAQLSDITSQRNGIFDIYCQNEKGDRFIVEMQKAKLNFFKDRTVFYTTFPIKEQAEKGDWDFKLSPVYCVALLDFIFDDTREQKNHISHVQLKDQFCQIFFDKLAYIFIEMPRFTKTEEELENHFDKWLYFLKHLEDFETIPRILKEEVFVKAFEVAEIAAFDQEQLYQYERSLKRYREVKGFIDTAYDEGLEEGREEGREEGEINKAKTIAEEMKNDGESLGKILKYTGLSTEEIEKL